MIRYIYRFSPEITKNNPDFEKIYDSQKNEISELNEIILQIILNLSIYTSDLHGVEMWEKIFRIKGNKEHSLEERRNDVLNQKAYLPPYTNQRLQEILHSIWGDGNYFYEYDPNNFTLNIDINTTNPIIYLQFSQKVRDVIPANIYINLAIQYTHFYLQKYFTYGNLVQFTYGDLSQYA